jgi:hypothetical protein
MIQVLGRRDFPGANALAYLTDEEKKFYENDCRTKELLHGIWQLLAAIRGVFVTDGTSHVPFTTVQVSNVIKPFTFVIYEFSY